MSSGHESVDPVTAPAGLVLNTQGEVVILLADGTSALLAPGDWLPLGATIQTTDGSELRITLIDGRVLLLKNGESLVLAPEFFDPAVLEDADAIARLISRLEAIDPTAAGPDVPEYASEPDAPAIVERSQSQSSANAGFSSTTSEPNLLAQLVAEDELLAINTRDDTAPVQATGLASEHSLMSAQPSTTPQPIFVSLQSGDSAGPLALYVPTSVSGGNQPNGERSRISKIVSLDVFTGTDEDDFQTGSTASEIFYGLGGNDVLDGGAGRDSLLGGEGDDTIYGGLDSDWVTGGNGNDQLHGGDGRDHIYGGAGQDDIFGGADGDELIGGLGDDKIYGAAGHDWISGQDGNDFVRGGSGKDYIYTGNGDDVAYGDEDEDELWGEMGNDTLHGGSGHDYLAGNEGNDFAYGDDGDDRLFGGAGNDTLVGGAGNDHLYGDGDGYLRMHNVEDPAERSGTSENGLINAIETDLGEDTLNGGAGADHLDGGRGNNTLIGGEGADLFLTTLLAGQNSTDTILDFSADQLDVLSISFSGLYEDLKADSNSDTSTSIDLLDLITDIRVGDYGSEFVISHAYNGDSTASTKTIRLAGFDVSSYGDTRQSVIDAMMEAGVLLTDLNTTAPPEGLTFDIVFG